METSKNKLVNRFTHADIIGFVRDKIIQNYFTFINFTTLFLSAFTIVHTDSSDLLFLICVRALFSFTIIIYA